MIYYKLRKRDDPDLYVKGTPSYNSYDKTGRIFSTLGQLRAFLTCVMNDSGRVGDWEVVELDVVVKVVKGVHEVISPKKLTELLMR